MPLLKNVRRLVPTATESQHRTLAIGGKLNLATSSEGLQNLRRRTELFVPPEASLSCLSLHLQQPLKNTRD
jgi:hypothetical protein